MGSGLLLKRKRRVGHTFFKHIICVHDSREEAEAREALLVGPDEVADPVCLNLIEGGGVGTLGRIASSETRLKMSASQKGKTPTADHRRKISESKTGKLHSVEARRRMSAAQKGRKYNIDRDAEIVRRYNEGQVSQEQVAAEFGLAPSSINRILLLADTGARQRKVDRDAAIVRRHSEGIPRKQIAIEFGLSKTSVNRSIEA